MRWRVKRSKGYTSNRAESSSLLSNSTGRCRTNQISSPDDFTVAEHIFRPDSGQFESGSFATRCSFKLIHQVVSRLDEFKRGLVQSSGFEGILNFPEIKQINRKFVLWLMSSIDESSRTLVVGDDIRIKFCKLDVATVFGIPCCGRPMLESGGSIRAAKEKVLDDYLGAVFKQERSIKTLVEVIDHKYVYPMSKAEQDSFIVA